MKKKNLAQGWLNEALSHYAERGEVDGMKEELANGADLFYQCADLNLLDKAVINNRLEAVKLLLKLGFADRPECVGKAMRYAKNLKIFRCLASSRPDCTVDVFKGFTPFDQLVIDRKYELVDLYRQYGLPKTPINPKVLSALNCRCELDGWESYTGIIVPDRYKLEWETISTSCLYDTKTKRRKFKKLLAGVISHSQAGESIISGGNI